MRKMIDRVRAVLVTPDGCLLVIRRDRPDRATYWVLPGGHVDPGDQSLEAALSREISEEIAGMADITSLLHVLDPGQGTNGSTSTSAGSRHGTSPRAPARSSAKQGAAPTTWSRSR
jgi:ADP-ribose pyrophosphatase YjhB (NUDIX family)